MALAHPRVIEGPIGSRIRVILGESGEDWLLLLNHDDGNSKWQSQHWGGRIPHALARQVNNCVAKGRYCREIDFVGRAETEAWYVHGIKWDGTGGFSWWGGLDGDLSALVKGRTLEPHHLKVSFGERYGDTSMCLISGSNGYSFQNVDDELIQRAKKCHNQRKTIHMVRLFHGGAYFIRDDNGYMYNGLGEHLGKEISKSKTIAHDVAMAEDGSWVVVFPGCYVASTGVSQELQRELGNFYRQQQSRQAKRNQEILLANKKRAAEEAAKELAAKKKKEEEEQRAKAEEQRAKEEEQRAKEEANRRAEAEAAAREEQQRRDKDLAEKFAREEQLVHKLAVEMKAIEDLEDSILEKERESQRRKRTLEESMKSLPPEQRRRLQMNDSPLRRTNSMTNDDCIVCQDGAPVRAVVPCGHMCLCERCAISVTNGPAEQRRCPLCRITVQSTIRIYLGSNC
jgi:Zinc finger, C3HC4 type (RING finger)